ncbi:hypothetical protein [Streptosporangium sp. NPDC006930]|uniref:hypothetical protein n=1 Tax=unclassified Streptosporangium TaxID=2632669 RepID=UPI00342E17B2
MVATLNSGASADTTAPPTEAIKTAVVVLSVAPPTRSSNATSSKECRSAPSKVDAPEGGQP